MLLKQIQSLLEKALPAEQALSEVLNAYYVDKPGKKPPTKIDVQLWIEDILAAKVRCTIRRVIKDFHIKTGHGGIVKLRMSMEHKYKIPRPAIEKFLSGSQTRIPDLKIGDCVLITVPKVDRGPSDLANVIAVIVNQNEHKLHQLGTKYGLVKGWYNSASLNPATSNFFKITEVNNNKELTLRERVSYISEGQGILSCICEHQCETKRCACFKASVKCNSRCHSSNNICKNK
ncbi:Hypothetical protein CINCED_3A025695 [Cinara cedri]|uniref:Uncharacterized protein n=1 Tax=Cinara cedri TaxID=506608 RepID=A0A5E4N8P0_9HEMI|nr:Hypothetical protein CINCED_3A025695 [Cinara cedri]